MADQPEEGSAGSSQPGSSQLEGFEPLQPQTSAESYQTAKSAKSVGMYDMDQKTEWRGFDDTAQLGKFGFGEEEIEFLSRSFVYKCQGHKQLTFSQFLANTARGDLADAKAFLTTEQNKRVRWDIPYQNYLNDISDDRCDDLVFIWLKLKQLGVRISPENSNAITEALSALMPSIQEISIPELAFDQEEKATRAGQHASSYVLEKVLKYFSDYDGKSHLAPYTSIVGPSGIGKSYSVKQLAVKHDIYVFYTNFASKGYQGYPVRSAIAEKIPECGEFGEKEARGCLASFWDSVICVGLTCVAICRELQISPHTFFDLQAKQNNHQFQGVLAKIVGNLCDNMTKIKRGPLKARPAEVLEAMENDLREALTEYAIPSNDRFRLNKSAEGVPEVLFCVDEGRTLLDSTGSLKFRAWRDMLRTRFSRTKKLGTVGEGAYFAVILDTSSKVVDFSPPARHDPSQKRLRPAENAASFELFPPIYEIETIDAFANNTERTAPTGSHSAVFHLLHFGRPLWPSQLINGSVNEVLELATQKISGKTNSQRLALLSYRLNFYVNSHALAEDLVSNWMRYIDYINHTRDVMLTSQPSEPILAHTAAQEMAEPKTRLAVIERFVSSSFEGSVNIGDLGEMTSAIVLMFAFDEVLFRADKGAWPMAVSLKEFINSLLGAQACSSMAECAKADNMMKGIWESGQVFFNHFQRLEQRPTEETLRTAFDRGCGLFLPINFPGIDIILPVRYANDSMSFFAVSVKNRKDDHWVSSLRNETISSFHKAKSELKLSMPFFGLTMALRGQEPMFGILYPSPKHHKGLRSHKKSKTSTAVAPEGRQYSWPGEGPKYIIGLAIGMDENVYPSIHQCRGLETDQSRAIPGLLQELLNCIVGVSLPSDANLRYISHLRSIK